MLSILYEIATTVGIVVVIASIAAGLIVSYREWAWRQWARAHNKASWLLDVLLVTNVIQDVAGLWIMCWAVYRLLGNDIPYWTSPITILMIGILFAKKVWRHRIIIKHANRELMRSHEKEPQ